MIVNVKSGYGYIREVTTGHIIAKAELPKGQHEIKDGYDYIEVESANVLALVELYKSQDIEKAAADNRAIQAEIESIAIASLKAKGIALESQAYKDK
jgi:hypothetical protein